MATANLDHIIAAPAVVKAWASCQDCPWEATNVRYKDPSKPRPLETGPAVERAGALHTLYQRDHRVVLKTETTVALVCPTPVPTLAE